MNVDICSNAYCNHSSFYFHFKGENIKVALRDLLIFMGGAHWRKITEPWSDHREKKKLY